MLRHQEEWRKQAFDSQINEYPEDMKEEYARLSDWIRRLVQVYRLRVTIRVIDAFSPVGLIKAIRHRFRKYPTFIVGRRDTYTGWDEKQLEQIIDRHVAGSKITA